MQIRMQKENIKETMKKGVFHYLKLTNQLSIKTHLQNWPLSGGKRLIHCTKWEYKSDDVAGTYT